MRNGIAVVALEERTHCRVVGVFQRGEGMVAVERPEERASERSVDVRQRNHHRTAVRPDVQGVGLDSEAAMRAVLVVGGRNRQFLVTRGQIGLRKIESTGPLHGRANRAESAVGSDHQIRFNPFLSAVGMFEDRGRAMIICEVGVDASRLEDDLDAGAGRRGFDEQAVESAPAHGVDRPLRVTAIGREDLLAVQVDHSAGHLDRLGEYFGFDARDLQRVQSSDADREIDGTPALRIGATRIAAPLEEPHSVPGLPELGGEHGSGEPGSGDHDVVRFRHGESGRSRKGSQSDRRTSATRRQSANVL